MSLRADLVILAALVGGSTYAILREATPPETERPVALGERVPGFALEDIGGEVHTLNQWRGREATVLYFWGLECPCVAACEERMKQVVVRYERRGVEVLGVNSEPPAERRATLDKMAALHAPYRMWLDPEGRVRRRLGVRNATQVVVLDEELRVRYRGSIDDDWQHPTRSYLTEALEALLAGRDPSPAETKPYGCPYPGADDVPCQPEE